MEFQSTISTVGQLRALYRTPGDRAANKVQRRIDSASAQFIRSSPFVLLATADASGQCDVSPRGGPPGFAVVLDDQHVALPDLVGNNRLDSYTNLMVNPLAALLFVVPGKDETVRINDPATLTTDDAVLKHLESGVRPPKLAIVVQAEELFGHCAKAFRRGQVWNPASWAELSNAPDLATIYACQFDGADRDELRTAIDATYAEDLPTD